MIAIVVAMAAGNWCGCRKDVVYVCVCVCVVFLLNYVVVSFFPLPPRNIGMGRRPSHHSSTLSTRCRCFLKLPSRE